jgi:hypothetical protein
MNHAKRTRLIRTLRESLVNEALADAQSLTIAEEYATMELQINNVAQWPGWLLRAAAKGC